MTLKTGKTQKEKEERPEVMGRAWKAGRNVGEGQTREERQEEKEERQEVMGRAGKEGRNVGEGQTWEERQEEK